MNETQTSIHYRDCRKIKFKNQYNWPAVIIQCTRSICEKFYCIETCVYLRTTPKLFDK